MSSNWQKQKHNYDLLAVRFPKQLTTLGDLTKIAKVMSKTRRIWPVTVARMAIVAFVYSWKRDHGLLELPPFKLKTR